MIRSFTAASTRDIVRFEVIPSTDRPSPMAKSAQGVSAAAKMFRYALSGNGIGRPVIAHARPIRVDSTIGLSTICFIRATGRALPSSPRPSLSSRMTVAGNITAATNTVATAAGSTAGWLAVDRVKDRQRHEPGIGHGRRHSVHGAAGNAASQSGVNRQKNQQEAEDGAAPECEQKAPFQKTARRLLRDRHDQQRRHRDIVGEMHEPVGERSRYVAEPSGEPAGKDDRKYGQDQIGHLHLLLPGGAVLDEAHPAHSEVYHGSDTGSAELVRRNSEAYSAVLVRGVGAIRQRYCALQTSWTDLPDK